MGEAAESSQELSSTTSMCSGPKDLLPHEYIDSRASKGETQRAAERSRPDDLALSEYGTHLALDLPRPAVVDAGDEEHLAPHQGPAAWAGAGGLQEALVVEEREDALLDLSGRSGEGHWG